MPLSRMKLASTDHLYIRLPATVGRNEAAFLAPRRYINA